MSYMPDDVFDMGLAMLVMSKYLPSGDMCEENATTLAREYEPSYKSENPATLKKQWVKAASEVYDAMTGLEIDSRTAVWICQERQTFLKKFDRDGNKHGLASKLPILGGTFFSKGSYDPKRVENSVHSFKRFIILKRNALL